jgi:hypothetical protein
MKVIFIGDHLLQMKKYLICAKCAFGTRATGSHIFWEFGKLDFKVQKFRKKYLDVVKCVHYECASFQ